MRIPVYRAEGRVSTDMPGRPIRARRSVAREAEQELAKAAPAKAALAAIGEYAETRYKMETKNNLDNALLDAQEALRERREELAKSDLYGSVLDGDDPIWTRETSKLQRELSDRVGSDRYAQQQFQSQFRQLEIQNRFALRGDIDRRVEIASLQNRERKLTDVENQIANSQDLSVISMALQGVVNDTQKMAQIKAGDLSSLTKQQYAMIYNGTARALRKYADSATSGVLAIDEMRRALRDSLPSDFYGPEKEEKPVGEEALSSSGGAYVYGLMKMLSPEDQAKMLKAVGGLQTFFEGPTIAEEQAQELAKLYTDEISSSINIYTDNLPNQTLPEETILNLETSVGSVIQQLEPDEQIKITKELNDLKELNSLKIGLGRRLTLKNIDDYVKIYAKGFKGRGLEGRDTDFENKALKMVEDFRDAMVAQLGVNGDAIAFAETNKTDTVNIQPVNLSLEALSTGESGLEQRILAGKKLQYLNGLPYTPVLSQEEANLVLSNIQAQQAPADQAAYLKLITDKVSMENKGFLLESLRRKGLAPEFVQAMYIDDPKVFGDLIATKDLETSKLKAGLEKSKASGVTGVSSTLVNLPFFQNYASAYVAGGDGARAVELLTEQRLMAEKLALYYAYTMDVNTAVEKAVESIFPGEVQIDRNLNFIVPKGLDADKISTAAKTIVRADVLNRFELAPLSDPRFSYLQNVGINAASLSSNGKWLNNSTGDGVVLHYDLEGTFIPVLLKDGAKPLEFKFTDLEKMNLLELKSGQDSLTPEVVSKSFVTGFKNIPTEITGAGTYSLGVSPAGSEFGLDEDLNKRAQEALKEFYGQ